MDAFSAFSTAPSTGTGPTGLINNSGNNGLGVASPSATVAFLSNPSTVAAASTLGSGGGGGAAVTRGMGGPEPNTAAGAGLFSTVPSSQPKPLFGSPVPGMMGRPVMNEMTLFSTAAPAGQVGSVDRSGAASPPVPAGLRGLQCHLRASREYDPNDALNYTNDVRRVLESIQATDAVSGQTSRNRSGAGSAAAAPAGAPQPPQAMPSSATSPALISPETAAVTFWYPLVDAKNPSEAARRLTAELERTTTAKDLSLKAIAACLTTPPHLAIIPELPEPYRSIIRDYTLQDVLEQFERANIDDTTPRPNCALMLTEMTRLGLVSLKGVAATIAYFLAQPNSCRASIATFGCVAENTRGTDLFLREMSKTERRLLELYKDPQFDYDVLAINRLLSASGMRSTRGVDGGSGVDDQVGTLLHESYQLKRQDGNAPVSCLQYVPQRDELFSAHGDGVVALWGPSRAGTAAAAPSNQTTSHTSTPMAERDAEVVVRTMIDMPQESLAVAMAAPQRGHFVVAAGMPAAAFGPSHPFTPHWKARHGGQRASVSSGGISHVSPLLRLLVCSENTGEWGQGSVIQRPTAAAITAVAAVTQNSCVCTAESRHDVTGSGFWQHNIHLINAPTGQLVQTIRNAHIDFITALGTCGDAEHVLISAARPYAMKLWDTRANGANAVATTSSNGTESEGLFRMEGGQGDTITSVHTFDNLIAATSLDGSFALWDTRFLQAPVKVRQFTSPVLDLSPLDGSKWAVATARGLFLVSKEMMSMDVIPNVAFTQICSNYNGELLFAAGADGITVFSVKK